MNVGDNLVRLEQRQDKNRSALKLCSINNTMDSVIFALIIMLTKSANLVLGWSLAVEPKFVSIVV